MRGEFGVHRARAHDANADIVRAKLLRDGVAQTIQSPFRGSIGGPIGQSVLSGKGRDVDDVPSTRLDHEWRHTTYAIVDAAKVRREDRVPCFWSKLVKRGREAAYCGVINQDINAL